MPTSSCVSFSGVRRARYHNGLCPWRGCANISNTSPLIVSLVQQTPKRHGPCLLPSGACVLPRSPTCWFGLIDTVSSIQGTKAMPSGTSAWSRPVWSMMTEVAVGKDTVHGCGPKGLQTAYQSCSQARTWTHAPARRLQATHLPVPIPCP